MTIRNAQQAVIQVLGALVCAEEIEVFHCLGDSFSSNNMEVAGAIVPLVLPQL